MIADQPKSERAVRHRPFARRSEAPPDPPHAWQSSSGASPIQNPCPPRATLRSPPVLQRSFPDPAPRWVHQKEAVSAELILPARSRFADVGHRKVGLAAWWDALSTEILAGFPQRSGGLRLCMDRAPSPSEG